jgi:hypothetical protein
MCRIPALAGNFHGMNFHAPATLCRQCNSRRRDLPRRPTRSGWPSRCLAASLARRTLVVISCRRTAAGPATHMAPLAYTAPPTVPKLAPARSCSAGADTQHHPAGALALTPSCCASGGTGTTRSSVRGSTSSRGGSGSQAPRPRRSVSCPMLVLSPVATATSSACSGCFTTPSCGPPSPRCLAQRQPPPPLAPSQHTDHHGAKATAAHTMPPPPQVCAAAPTWSPRELCRRLKCAQDARAAALYAHPCSFVRTFLLAAFQRLTPAGGNYAHAPVQSRSLLKAPSLAGLVIPRWRRPARSSEAGATSSTSR